MKKELNDNYLIIDLTDIIKSNKFENEFNHVSWKADKYFLYICIKNKKPAIILGKNKKGFMFQKPLDWSLEPFSKKFIKFIKDFTKQEIKEFKEHLKSIGRNYK